MPTRQAIREGCIPDLGLGIINKRGVFADSDTITVTSLRDILGDTDNRLLEGSFLFIRTPIASAYTTAVVTLGAAITTVTATSISYIQAANSSPQIQAGDIIRVTASEDMLVTDVPVPAGSGTGTLTVVRGVNSTTAVTHLNGAAVTFNTKGQWRSISAHSFSNNNVDLVRSINGIVTDLVSFDIYFILNPEEINTCIDIALSKLWSRGRATITLTDGDNEYNLTTAASWLTDPSQIIDLCYRYESDTGYVKEVAVTNRKIISDDDVVTVTLYDMPGISTDGWDLVVNARQWYSELTHDEATTTCPLPLIRAQAKVQVLEKIFNKLGKQAKDNYGVEMAIAEKELERMKARYRQAITHTNLVQEHPFTPVEVPISDTDWNNWGGDTW